VAAENFPGEQDQKNSTIKRVLNPSFRPFSFELNKK